MLVSGSGAIRRGTACGGGWRCRRWPRERPGRSWSAGCGRRVSSMGGCCCTLSSSPSIGPQSRLHTSTTISSSERYRPLSFPSLLDSP